MKKIRYLVLLIGLVYSNYGISQTVTAISGNVNQWTGVQDLATCLGSQNGQFTTWLDVQSTSGFFVGDSILIIQMKGATVLTGTSNYGQIDDPKGTGLSEVHRIEQITGNRIFLNSDLSNPYTPLVPAGLWPYLGGVQIVKIAQYEVARVVGPVTCKDWDGSSGGIIYINASVGIVLQDNIVADAAGFRGGIGVKYSTTLSNCNTNVNNAIISDPNHGMRGEGISTISSNGKGSAPLANAGGSGSGHNAGGGGGSNVGIGGRGGMEFNICPSPIINGGRGGVSLTANRLYLGGGGGSGHANDGRSPHAGRGGGIVIIRTPLIAALPLSPFGVTISANGQSVIQPSGIDGSSGGGGGGTISICAEVVGSIPISLSANGGKGGDVFQGHATDLYGPGGGGGGGVIYHTADPLYVVFNQIPPSGANVQQSGNVHQAQSGSMATEITDCYWIYKGVPNCLIDIEVTGCPGEDIEICFTPCSTSGVLMLRLPFETETRIVDPADGEYCFTYSIPMFGTNPTISFFAPFDRAGDNCAGPNGNPNNGINVLINVKAPDLIQQTVPITCGDQVDLSQFHSLCPGGTPGPWLDMTNQMSLIGSVVSPTNTTVYQMDMLSGSGANCRLCRFIITVVVTPLPVEVIPVNRCEFDQIELQTVRCAGGDLFTWFFPNGGSTGAWAGLDSWGVTAHDGDIWTAVTTLPNGCLCSTQFVIETNLLDRGILNPITINCGDDFDFSQYATALCGTAFYRWDDLDHQMSVITPDNTAIGTTRYRISCYSDETYSCLISIAEIDVTVLPLPPFPITKFACEEALITIGADANCLGSGPYIWTKNGLPIPFSSATLIIAAHDGDSYSVSTYNQDGCACTTNILIRTTSDHMPDQHEEVVCGEIVDLTELETGCDGEVTHWYDHLGNLVPDPTNILVNGNTPLPQREFTKKSFSADGCVICEIKVIFDVLDKDPVFSTMTIRCEQDMPILSPILCHFAAPFLIYDANGVLVPQPFYIPRNTFDGSVFTVVEIGPDGCRCEERITITTLPIPPIQETLVKIDVSCGDEVDLNDYSGCDGGEWQIVGDPDPYPGNIYTATDLVKHVIFVKNHIDPVTCQECISTLEITVHERADLPYTIDQIQRFFCEEATFDPSVSLSCPEAVTFKWFDQNGELVSESSSIEVNSDLDGTRTRKGYAADGCVVCYEIFNLNWKTHITDPEIALMPGTFWIEVMDCDLNCYTSPSPAQLPVYTSNNTCTWSPIDPIDANGHYTVCPPWTQYSGGIIRKCMNEEGCVFAVEKIEVITIPCDMGDMQRRISSVEEGKFSELKIYPNPNTGQFSIAVTGNPEIELIQMFDMLGKEVAITLLESSSDEVQVSINQPISGIYMVKIKIEGISRSYLLTVVN